MRVNRRGACFGQYRLFRARGPDAANGRQDVDLHVTLSWREILTAPAGKSMFDESTVNLPRGTFHPDAPRVINREFIAKRDKKQTAS